MRVVATILITASLFVFSLVIYNSISLKQECTGYLKRAADANTVESATEQLQKSIHYLESNGLTNGYTSVLWQTPDEDIEFWYKNLKASESELLKVDSTTSSLEKTNLLMKLRETLIDNGEKGDKLTVPNGLSRYPNNGTWAIFLCLSFLIFIGSILYLVISFE